MIDQTGQEFVDPRPMLFRDMKNAYDRLATDFINSPTVHDELIAEEYQQAQEHVQERGIPLALKQPVQPVEIGGNTFSATSIISDGRFFVLDGLLTSDGERVTLSQPIAEAHGTANTPGLVSIVAMAEQATFIVDSGEFDEAQAVFADSSATDTEVLMRVLSHMNISPQELSLAEEAQISGLLRDVSLDESLTLTRNYTL